MSQNVSMMWAYLVALTESTSVVTRYPRYSGTSTPCSGSRNALDIQENAQQSSKTCIVAAVTGVESRPSRRGFPPRHTIRDNCTIPCYGVSSNHKSFRTVCRGSAFFCGRTIEGDARTDRPPHTLCVPPSSASSSLLSLFPTRGGKSQ